MNKRNQGIITSNSTVFCLDVDQQSTSNRLHPRVDLHNVCAKLTKNIDESSHGDKME